MNYNRPHYELYEESGYDPLDDPQREQSFNDKFWSFPIETIEDLSEQANPPSLPELY